MQSLSLVCKSQLSDREFSDYHSYLPTYHLCPFPLTSPPETRAILPGLQGRGKGAFFFLTTPLSHTQLPSKGHGVNFSQISR